MKVTIWLFRGAGVVMLAAGWLANPVAALAQEGKPEVASKITGTWRGESLCVDKNSGCHDEIAVYRIATIAGKTDALLVSGGKMVDGKEVVLGKGEWAYDRPKSTLMVDLPMGAITLKQEGDTLKGTYVLHDKSVLRRITLKKAE